jgi:hypothetical protein
VAPYTFPSSCSYMICFNSDFSDLVPASPPSPSDRRQFPCPHSHRGRGSPFLPRQSIRSSQRREEEMGSNAAGKPPPPPAAAVSWEFHATGPRNLTSPGWRDLIRSSWYAPLAPHFHSLGELMLPSWSFILFFDRACLFVDRSAECRRIDRFSFYK